MHTKYSVPKIVCVYLIREMIFTDSEVRKTDLKILLKIV